MGADHKGPLAAFVVIAIIAAVLLVTSVRSQAEPGWRDLQRLMAAPPVARVMPAGVQHPAGPSAPASSTGTSTTDASSSLGSTLSPTSPSTQATQTAQGSQATHTRQGNAGHGPHAPANSDQGTITQEGATGQGPVSDSSGTPGSPGSSQVARHGFDPRREFALGHGPFDWRLHGAWLGDWQRWISAQRETHPWWSHDESRHSYWSH